MTQIPPPPVPTQLIVFADDWGRHPSSSQHLVRALLPQYPTLWVNTVGTRRPTISFADLGRGMGVLASWMKPAKAGDRASLPQGLRVISPKMYPGYRAGWQRGINDTSVACSVNAALMPGHRRVVVTTLPTTAGLVPKLHADRWLYYCVDNYAEWPGTDHSVMHRMEQALVRRVDCVACVSDTLLDRVLAFGTSRAERLTHGVHLEMWQQPALDSRVCQEWPDETKPVALFWGLIDARLDASWIIKLVESDTCQPVLAGPSQSSPETAIVESRCWRTGPIPHRDLPAHAAKAAVLIMPYIDAPVTRAMQPLKLLEYLATMKPVVVRDLPSTRAWADCCDLANDAESFVRLVQERIQTGTPPEQIEARKRRLPGESWSAKAAQLAAIINEGA